MDTRWRIELLDGLRAESAGRVVTRFPTQKTGALLAYLAYYAQRAHLREELIDLLWSESELEAGRQSLSRALSSLRHLLEPPAVPAGTLIVADRATVRLDPAVITTDVAEFEAALRSVVRAGESTERAQRLTQAVDLYRGPLLAGSYEDWVLREREWLAERYFQALTQLIAHLEGDGDWNRALEYAHRGVSADPLREEAHRELIRLYAAAGQPAAALRQYRELERVLQQELGARPEVATRALVHDIERQSALRPQPSLAPRHRPISSLVPPQTQPEGENRLVTVLFADMSRSVETTRDLHPEAAAELVSRLLGVMVDALLKYEGRVDRFLGDGVLAVFGTLQTHEDDPERAIRAALEIREAAQKLGLEVTAGINTGEVYVGAVGTERHQERTVVGPVVNLASRLQEQAEPGQILVGEATYRLTRRAFAFAPLSLTLKGLAQPVGAFLVTQALPHPEKARGIDGLRAELIGREEELAKLLKALAELRRGRGQIVSLTGEAGLGKSRLVAELKLGLGSQLSALGKSGPGSGPEPRAESREPPLWLEGRCLELGMTASYWPFIDIFRQYLEWHPEAAQQTRAQRLVAALQAFAARGDLSPERVEEMGPLLGQLLSLRFGTDWDDRLKNAGPEQIKHQTLLALQDFLAALAKHRPVLLVLEDLHWADSLSLDVISLLMETLPREPLLLLCVYRPEREHKCWRLGTIAAQKCPERYTELHLRELTPPQSRRLVESLLTIEDLPAAVKALILERSRGNPFFVEEVIRSLMASGMVYREGDVWRAKEGIEGVAVPESVQSLIQSRVDRLDGDLKHVVQSAAVIGRLFRRRLLEYTMQATGDTSPDDHFAAAPPVSSPGALERALWELEDHQFIYQERVVPEEEYSFKHVLTQETIYGSLLRRRRAVLHQRVAEAIEALYPEGLEAYYEPLAYHYERSAADEKAVEYLLKAGEKARRAYLSEEATGYFQRALERIEESPVRESRKEWRLEALKGLGRIHHGMGRESEAEQYFRQAIALGQEIGLAPQELVRLHSWLGDLLWWQSRFDELIRVGEEGLALLGDDTESVEAVLMRDLIALGHVNKGDYAAARETWREFADRNAQLIERLPYSEELRPAYVHVFEAYTDSERNIDKAMKWLRCLEQKAEQHHHLTALANVPQYIASITTDTGNLGEAIPHRQRALELYAKIGDTKHQASCLFHLARTFLSLGDLQAAAESALRGLELAQSMGSKSFAAELHMMVGTISLCQSLASTEDRWQKPADAFQKAVQLSRDIGSWVFEAQATSLLGRVYLAQGEQEEASRQFQEALALAKANVGTLAAALSGLEEAYDDPEKFRAFWVRFREEHHEVGGAPFFQWLLEPTEPLPLGQKLMHDEFVESLSSDWVWQDPFDDCSFTVQNGLEVHAANGRDLWQTNLSAPRVLQSVAGEFAAQTVCAPVSREKPAIGGLLLWKDRQNFLRLDRGIRGREELSFSGCLENQDLILGRGRLPSGRLFLRLERRAGRVNALCSADGRAWFSVGDAAFPADGPVDVGLHAIGAIDRTLYPDAYPDGTAIRFEMFQLWR